MFQNEGVFKDTCVCIDTYIYLTDQYCLGHTIEQMWNFPLHLNPAPLWDNVYE